MIRDRMPILISILRMPEFKDAEFMVYFAATRGKVLVTQFA